MSKRVRIQQCFVVVVCTADFFCVCRENSLFSTHIGARTPETLISHAKRRVKHRPTTNTLRTRHHDATFSVRIFRSPKPPRGVPMYTLPNLQLSRPPHAHRSKNTKIQLPNACHAVRAPAAHTATEMSNLAFAAVAGPRHATALHASGFWNFMYFGVCVCVCCSQFV